MSSLNIPGECRFCEIGKGRFDSALGAVDRAWYHDANYLSLASVGAMVAGWSLLIPRAHSLSLVASYEDPAFYEAASNVLAAVENEFGPCVVFEHGANSACSETSCGTAHAHLHVVPMPIDLEAAAERFDIGLTWTQLSIAQVASHVAGREYLLVANRFEGVATRCRVAILEEGRSQFFRRVIARALGRESSYSYREFPELALSNETAERLSRARQRLPKVA